MLFVTLKEQINAAAKLIENICIISAKQAGFTERMTILLSTYTDIDKDAAWLNDEALRSGVFFSLPARDHHVNALAVNSQILSPGTTNLIAMTRRKTDRLRMIFWLRQETKNC